MEFMNKWFIPGCFFAMVIVVIFVVIKIAIWMWPAAVVAGHGASYAIANPLNVVVGLLIAFCLLGTVLK